MIRNVEALIAFIASREAVPFSWADNHCVGFAAAAVRAQTGRDPMRGIRITTERGAAQSLSRRGGMAAAVSSRLRPIAPAMAMRGDIAGVADARFGLRLMVVEGDTLVAPGPRGNRRAPRSAMVRAWAAD